jgi:hypothetical protein
MGLDLGLGEVADNLPKRLLLIREVRVHQPKL